ncbi:hypothetical protein [Mesorhizobium koreense]|jgi:hypothetical protein|uniref:hypothetical protein n=1 Tax=Mesorhizobium koreense TaxID=3074855 RepID=UPI00287BA0BC|nr:hypothetical protein [Mesorhizobium sp. WR6]
MRRRLPFYCSVAGALSVTVAAMEPAAAADCYSVGQQVAAQKGGQLAKARPETRGGKTVCVVVVLIPAKDGQRPRRAEIVVPAG